MKELASGINETIGQCDAGLKTVDRMYSQAEQGVAVSQSLGGFMTDLELTYGELEAIHRAISEVSNMTDLINNIVFKTQILSFNASIEAAAAGAHGSGFAFIAAEVGKLANTTGTAAEQIGQQVEASRKLIQKTLEASRSRVAKAQGATRDGSRYFEELVGQAKDVKNVMNTIHETATLQGNKATTVSRGVDQINEGTSTLERAVHSVSGISKNMESQAQDLAVAVGGLKGLIQGGGSSDRDKKAA
jgi:methyl-accepting chemotaxis protein